MAKTFEAVKFAEAFHEIVGLKKGQGGQAFLVFPDRPGICHPLSSDKVKRALRSFAKLRGERLNENRIKEVLDELDAICYEEGEEVVSHLRVAPYSSGYIYNLGRGRFIQVADGTATFIAALPDGVYFTESGTMLAAPEPVLKPNIPGLLSWLNCNRAEQLLLLAWLTYTVATPKAAQLPYPILVIKAPAGSGKTFICGKVIRRLVDPSSVASQAMPKSIKEVAISASQSHLLVYDNLRYIRQELSDGLCQVATGGSIVSRMLYTDGQEFSIDLRCALVLNGIHTFATESDLVSRCVNITLNPIGEQRQSEGELGAKFEQQLPSLIYTLHTIAAKVLAVKDSVEVSYKSRMADFSIWISGLEAVLKLPHGALQNAYQANLERAKVAGVVDDSLFVALTHFAKRYSKTSPWHGTPHDLLRALEAQTAVSLGSDMPRSAAAMSRRLPVLLDALASNGVHVVRGRATDRFYDVYFEPIGVENAVGAVEATSPSVTPSAPSAEASGSTLTSDVEVLLS